MQHEQQPLSSEKKEKQIVVLLYTRTMIMDSYIKLLKEKRVEKL